MKTAQDQAMNNEQVAVKNFKQIDQIKRIKEIRKLASNQTEFNKLLAIALMFGGGQPKRS